jgi:hypothetical protein
MNSLIEKFIIKNLHKKSYLIAILSCAIIKGAAQDPLMQRAITTPESRRARSIQIEFANDVTIRPQINLAALTTDIINLKSQIDEIERDEEVLRHDKRNIHHHLNRLESLQHAQRIRPDRNDFKYRDDNKSCCMLTCYSGRSAAKDCFGCYEPKDDSLAVLRCRNKIGKAAMINGLLCLSLLTANLKSNDPVCFTTTSSCSVLCACTGGCCSHHHE